MSRSVSSWEYNMDHQNKTRLLTLALVGSGLLLAPIASFAIPVPYEFAPGDPVVAAELNANFDDLEATIAAMQANAASLAAQVADLTAEVDSSSASPCGETDPTDGAFGGYAGGKALCAAVNGCS